MKRLFIALLLFQVLSPRVDAAQQGEGLPAKKPQASPQPGYSSAGKRDPFRPLALKAKADARRPRENLSPLERYELGQLKLVGIIRNGKEGKALVEVMEEDRAVRGYTVNVGTAIGPNEGKVKAIQERGIVVEEIYTDFFGERKTREVTMNLPVE